MNGFEKYLILINAVGFFVYAVNAWLYTHTEKRQIDAAVTVSSLLGGSAGILLCILLFDRKAEKGNMMSRVFLLCIFIIQVVIVLVMEGYVADHVTFAFWTFFADHPMLLVYFAAINLITFAAFAVDKFAAIKHRSRVRIATLLGMSFAGGSIGGLLAMYFFRHKTKKDYFTVGIPLILAMQMVVLFYWMNASWQKFG